MHMTQSEVVRREDMVPPYTLYAHGLELQYLPSFRHIAHATAVGAGCNAIGLSRSLTLPYTRSTYTFPGAFAFVRRLSAATALPPEITLLRVTARAFFSRPHARPCSPVTRHASRAQMTATCYLAASQGFRAEYLDRSGPLAARVPLVGR